MERTKMPCFLQQAAAGETSRRLVSRGFCYGDAPLLGGRPGRQHSQPKDMETQQPGPGDDAGRPPRQWPPEGQRSVTTANPARKTTDSLAEVLADAVNEALIRSATRRRSHTPTPHPIRTSPGSGPE
ncbi:unnamed protein product [Diplocarpon coronariae]